MTQTPWHNLSPLTIGLWIGLGVLTLALLVLMLTRWGQARPLSKCVILSVLAHGLLFAYAYATKLFVDAPAPRRDEFIRLALLDPSDAERPEADAERNPWEQLAFAVDVQPDRQPLPRLETTPEEVPHDTTESTETAASIPLPPLTDVSIDAPPERPKVDVPAGASDATPSAATLVPPRAEASKTADPRVESPPGPAGPSPRHVTTRPPDVVGPSRRTSAAEPSRPIAESTADLQQRIQSLADVDVMSESARAIAAEDDPRKAANKPSADGGANPLSPATGGSMPQVMSLADLRDLTRPRNPGARPLAPPAADPRETLDKLIAEHQAAADDEPSRRSMPSIYLLRVSPERSRIARQLGATERSEQSVAAALRWLAANQEQDGRWDASRFEAGREAKVLGHDRRNAGAEADTGITGLSVLAFLAAGHSHLEGEHRRSVQCGLEFLLRSQRPDGNLSGDASMFAAMYCHGMALLAISEAYAMTGDRRLEPFARRGVAYSVASQNSTSGGWRYRPGDKGDMSQFGWQVMALKSAELAGIEIPSATRIGMVRFMSQVSLGRHGGLSAYKAGSGATATMTAEALLCRFLLDMERGAPLVDEAVELITSELTDDSRLNLYYHYYGTLALFQVQGERWAKWNGVVRERLVRAQRTDGELAGSWDPTTTWGSYGGRVYSTAMAALCLEVYYRYLPTVAAR